MAHPADSEIYPVDTIVSLKDTGEFARIDAQTFLTDRCRNFLHYLGTIEGRKGLYCLIHDRLRWEAPPKSQISENQD